MSLTERIDLALLARADAFVAWNRSRGAADQWELAKAGADISLALLLAAAVVDHAAQPGSSQIGYLFIGALFLFVRQRERRTIARLSGMPDGAFRARRSEKDQRQLNLVIMAGLVLLCLLAFDAGNLLFLASVAALDACNYFKAAATPPDVPSGPIDGM